MQLRISDRDGVPIYVQLVRQIRREQQRILAERIDMLLTEARQMKVDQETLITLIRQRGARIEESSR